MSDSSFGDEEEPAPARDWAGALVLALLADLDGRSGFSLSGVTIEDMEVWIAQWVAIVRSAGRSS